MWTWFQPLQSLCHDHPTVCVMHMSFHATHISLKPRGGSVRKALQVSYPSVIYLWRTGVSEWPQCTQATQPRYSCVHAKVVPGTEPSTPGFDPGSATSLTHSFIQQALTEGRLPSEHRAGWETSRGAPGDQSPTPSLASVAGQSSLLHGHGEVSVRGAALDRPGRVADALPPSVESQ